MIGEKGDFGYKCSYVVKIVGICGSSLWITSVFSEIGSKILRAEVWEKITCWRLEERGEDVKQLYEKREEMLREIERDCQAALRIHLRLVIVNIKWISQHGCTFLQSFLATSS